MQGYCSHRVRAEPRKNRDFLVFLKSGKKKTENFLSKLFQNKNGYMKREGKARR